MTYQALVGGPSGDLPSIGWRTTWWLTMLWGPRGDVANIGWRAMCLLTKYWLEGTVVTYQVLVGEPLVQWPR